MLLLAFEYLLFVFIASIGVLQWVVVRGGLRGLWFFRSSIQGYPFSLLAIISSYAWFFLSKDRNLPAHETGLEGMEQLLFFSLAALTALIVTLIISSFSNRGRFVASDERGLEALKKMTYFQAWRRAFRRDDSA